MRRELDFYIKNEVLFVDDLDAQDEQNLKTAITKVKVIKHIALKIIAFLAQLEDFQKKLWLKKKFVVSCGWCVTLDRVPKALYPEIIASDTQREEWVKLFAIDEIEADLVKPGYTQPLTIEFLQANPYLVLDTKHFDAQFKEKLLAGFDNLDEATDGIIINSENFQALNLLLEKYREQVKCVYIDPPYNTDASAICYKNGYKSSSWTSLMEGRLSMTRPVMTKDGVLVAAIDDTQHRELNFLLSDSFDGNMLGTICVRSNPSGRPTQTGYAVSHEYLLFAGQGQKSIIGRLPPTSEQLTRFNQRDENGIFEWRNLRREGSNSDRSARRALYYPIYIKGEEVRIPKMRWDENDELWVIEERLDEDEQVVYPDNEDGVQKTWRWEWNTVIKYLSLIAVRKDRSGKDYIYYKRRPNEDGVVSVSSWFDAKHSAVEHGTAFLKNLFGTNPFSYPKSIYAVIDSIYIAGAYTRNSIVLDYFGGSGTTANAVIILNREDGGKRKYILVEMGDYFDTVLKPRIQKVIYSKDWKDGKPVSREGSSHMFKYLRLESYDDTLDNLQILRTESQQATLENMEAKAREDYMLGYMLNIETKAGDSLLNIDRFSDPFSYTLKIRRDNELKDEKIDLVETFNYLIGLYVEQTETIRGFKVVRGRLRTGEKTLVIWRNTKEKTNESLDAFFKKQKYNTLDFEFDLIFVNGDNNLENLKVAEDKWKVRLIEEEFKKRMWESAL